MSYRLTPSSPGGHLFVAFVRAAGLLTRPFRNKGLYRAAKIVGRWISPGQRCERRWGGDCAFEFDLCDPYWSRTLSNSYDYEPELGHLLELLDPEGYAFLDCGANIGYWSVVATSSRHACTQAIAVEPVPETFERLKANARRNAGRFDAINRALYSAAGETVSLRYNPANLAGASIERVDAQKTAEVETTTLSDLVGALRDPDALVLVKLDVEGVEKAAMEAADALLARDFLIFYEDHAKDRTSGTTAFFQDDLGLDIHFIDDDGHVHRIAGTADATALKVDLGRGYNFAATRAGSRANQILARAAE